MLANDIVLVLLEKPVCVCFDFSINVDFLRAIETKQACRMRKPFKHFGGTDCGPGTASGLRVKEIQKRKSISFARHAAVQ
jgi:hypothetical protein